MALTFAPPAVYTKTLHALSITKRHDSPALSEIHQSTTPATKKSTSIFHHAQIPDAACCNAKLPPKMLRCAPEKAMAAPESASNATSLLAISFIAVHLERAEVHATDTSHRPLITEGQPALMQK